MACSSALRGGEAAIRPTEGMSHPHPDGGERNWIRHVADADIMDFRTVFGIEEIDNAVAYAFATFESPASGQACLSVGSDDGVKIWLNGVQTVNYVEREEDIARKGVIAVQIHGGMQATIHYKDIRIRELSAVSPERP